MRGKKRVPLYLGGEAKITGDEIQVLDKGTAEPLAQVCAASREDIEKAIQHAMDAALPMQRLAAFERRDILTYCQHRFQERSDELALLLCREAGKPLRDAKGEVARLIQTFQIAAEQATRSPGETLCLDLSDRSRGYQGFWKRFPVGPCAFITPFNFPLNLVAHKVAPAIAMGCPFVLKPASSTPLSALVVGEVLSQAGLPKGAFSILPCAPKTAEPLYVDDRIKLLSFTGSSQVGWELKAKAGKKKVILELGGNAACIVEPDWPIEDAVERVLVGGYSNNGQSCISVQRIYVHHSVYEGFREKLVKSVAALKVGSPMDPETQVGPLISEQDAQRLEQWVESAAKRGGRVLVGGKANGPFFQPTVMEKVPDDEPLSEDEAFGPIVLLGSYQDYPEALEKVNRSRFGLQAGVFTRDLFKAHQAWKTLEVGGVVIGEVPSWRSDAMPYGGVKDSGLGREGVRFAMEEMGEIRVMVIREPR